MDKRYLLAGAALFGAMLAGSTRQEPTASVEVSTKAEQAPLGVSRQFAARKPAPAKPTSQPVAQRRVATQAPLMYQPGFTRFIDRPHLRKVRYGKRRWVLV